MPFEPWSVAGPAFEHLGDRALSQQPLPGPWIVLATAMVALALVGLPATWPRVRLAITIVHEAGHALVAVLVGRRLAGIRLHSDTSGVTVSRGRPTGPGVVVMYAAGYLAPALLGLIAALLLVAGRALGLLWLLVLVLIVLVVWIRNLYGLAVVLGAVAVLGVASWFAPVDLLVVAAYLVTWVLLLAAPRPLLELLRAGRNGRRGSDPDHLARLTRVPAVLWIVVLLIANLAGLAVGVTTLLPELVG
ncbi:M50 family metallopeptidase [Nocardioides insulae]|uniref:M50 family metallopeptidase n=1 Tax=Nocardioides insulae TaxID=394734 RepID=UPI00040E0181|nr:M50 family metallopeptidase [Nocardioides insulae]